VHTAVQDYSHHRSYWFPNDTYAHPDNLGKWKCGNCIDRELQDRIIRVTPYSIRAKEIIAERKIKQEKELQFKRREAEIMKMPGE
jgi:hypothetical protein